LIKFLVEKLIEGLAEHLENGFNLLRFHFFLDKDAQLFNSFFGVFLEEVLHVELKNVFVLR
jgi:hypothetical protein